MSSTVRTISLEIEDSKDIAIISYYIKEKSLFVSFANQTFYRYYDVSISHILLIIDEKDSVGKYFHESIKNNYRFELVASGVEEYFTYLEQNGLQNEPNRRV